MAAKNYISKLVLILIASLFPAAILAQTLPQYQETGGIVIIEIESAISYDSWDLDSTKTGFTGDGYLQFNGPNYYSTPGNSLLKFELAINKTGKYRFQWHSLIAAGTSNTEHNDSWLRFHDASDFYGQKDTIKVYPKGVGKTPNPAGTSKNGWLKIYQNNLGTWTWKTRTSDHDPHEIYVEFDSAGIYTLEISGRSNGHAINRLALYHADVSSVLALNLNQPESVQINSVSIEELPYRNLALRPTLASQIIYLDIPPSISMGEFEGEIINSLGQELDSFSFRINGDKEVAIPVHQLSKGIYFVRFKKDSFFYLGKFVKQ